MGHCGAVEAVQLSTSKAILQLQVLIQDTFKMLCIPCRGPGVLGATSEHSVHEGVCCTQGMRVSYGWQ